MAERERFRVGDVLTVSCPFTEARITDLQPPGYLSVKWPWHRVDPETPQFRWNGNVAVTYDPTNVDWTRELFRTDPAPQHLKPGSTCRVGIPLTVVHVTGVAVFDPPQADGMLPRHAMLLEVLLAGRSEDPADDDQGCTIDPDDDIPTDINLLFRPYDFLRLGDEVLDGLGRSWRFDDPWRWQPPGGGAVTPAWPLGLTARLGGFDVQDAAAVRDATVTGSHSAEAARWSRLANATPPGHEPHDS